MTIPYRTRRRLQNLGIFLLILALVLAAVWAVWMVWLDRYVTYTRGGAPLELNRPMNPDAGELAAPPAPRPSVPLYIYDGEEQPSEDTGIGAVLGYYADTDMLKNDMETIFNQVRHLAPGTAVMLDVKDGYGRFYCSTGLEDATLSKNIDVAAMDELIELLRSRNLYLIARVPAFRDRLYGAQNVPDGLYHTSRRYLWVDNGNCYWLNPTRDGTMAHLMQIVSELKSLGFDEVVFDDFHFPDTENIYFDGDREQAIAEAAQTLVSTCATKSFAVSFMTDSPAFPLPQGRSRIYLANMDAANLADFVSQVSTEDPQGQLVFLTDSRDTRFAEYGILRPITSEIIDP